MDERQALMAAIIANPDEDTPRLAFADWLQEHGDEHDRGRAEFIRLQCELARHPGNQPQTAEHRRAKALHKKHVKSWMGPLYGLTGGSQFARGLLELWYSTASLFANKSHKKAVCEWLPTLGVGTLLLNGRAKLPEVVSGSPALAWVAEFNWVGSKLDDGGLRAFAQSPHMTRLSRLVLDDLVCTDAGLNALAKSSAFPNLRTLGLRADSSRSEYTHDGVLKVLQSEQFPNLDTLDLLDDLPAGFREAVFYDQPCLSRLRVFRSPWGSDAAKISRCSHFTHLESLEINGTTVTDGNALTLLKNPFLANLKNLHLNHVNLDRPSLSARMTKRLRDRFGSGLSL